MQNLVQQTLLLHLPGKRKQTASGWLSFNAVCCIHNGESADTRGRGGIVENITIRDIHMKDIQNIVERHYNKLNKFLESEDTILLPILQNIKQNTNEWYKLALNTPLLAEIKNSKTNEGFFSVFNDKIVI